MAGADACAKACLAMSPRPIELIVHSTLVYLRAIPLSLRTAGANGAAPIKPPVGGAHMKVLQRCTPSTIALYPLFVTASRRQKCVGTFVIMYRNVTVRDLR